MSPSFEAFSSLVIKLLWQDKWVIEQRSYRCQNVTTYGSAWFENDVTEISKGFGNDQCRHGLKCTLAGAICVCRCTYSLGIYLLRDWFGTTIFVIFELSCLHTDSFGNFMHLLIQKSQMLQFYGFCTCNFINWLHFHCYLLSPVGEN